MKIIIIMLIGVIVCNAIVIILLSMQIRRRNKMKKKRGVSKEIAIPLWAKGARFIEFCEHVAVKGKEVNLEKEDIEYLQVVEIECKICNVVHKIIIGK